MAEAAQQGTKAAPAPSAPAPAAPMAGPGAQRVAALLLGLGPELARGFFSQLSESEVRRVALGAKELRRRPAGLVPQALRTYVDAMEMVGGDAAAGDELLREAATEALGPDVARRAFEGVVVGPDISDDPMGPLGDADAEALALVLVREQAQTVALVLSNLPPAKAAAVMGFFPAADRPVILRRMASVEAVSPDVLREVRQALTEELQSVVSGGMRKVDGRNAALEILRRHPPAQQSEVLAAIASDDPALSEELRTKLFTFEDLQRLTDRDVQSLIKDINLKQLAIALKGASGATKDRFLRNMSSRASEMLADDLAAMGPVKLSEVEGAQGEIAKTALELAEKGSITLVRPTDKLL